jgi:predicted membrane-bound spermidine synthase
MSDSQPCANVRRRLLLYGVTVFVSSGVLLVLEMAAGRLIAPYVGVSLYSWTSIIGVILAGLSLGNWAGGVWADRGAGHGAVGLTLSCSGLASLAVLLLLTVVAQPIQNSGLGLLGASFAFVLSLFFLPAMLLGVVTPLLTTLALGLDERSGHVVGRMHALAALGSIAGTFAAGFWLIQWIGTRAVLVSCAVVLIVAALPFLARRWVAVAGLVPTAAVLAGVTQARSGFAEPCLVESQYYCLRVDDMSPEVPFGRAAGLVLDHLLHGVNHETEPGLLAAPYVHLADEIVLGYLGPGAGQARYLFLGGGAYTHPRAVRALAPEADVTVVEIDPAVTRIAREHLYVSTQGMRVLHTDARVALERMQDQRFDAIVGDVFHDLAMPYHLMTREFAELVRARLAPGGVYVLNVVDVHPEPRLVRSVTRTLREVFAHVHVWLERLPETPERETYIVTAAEAFEPPPAITAQRGFERTWMRITEQVMANDGGDAPVLTDDYVPVERLVSKLLLSGLGR